MVKDKHKKVDKRIWAKKMALRSVMISEHDNICFKGPF